MTADSRVVRLWLIYCAVFMEQEFVEFHMLYYMLEKLHKSSNLFVNICVTSSGSRKTHLQTGFLFVSICWFSKIMNSY